VTDTVARFSNRIENYAKYRPGYPRQIIPYLIETAGLMPESNVADVGCGTGLSARIFLENGNRVFGVEPNSGMRQAAVEYLSSFENFTIVNGTAEATTLSDRSVDLAFAAQAYHWFDPDKTRAEFKRILKPGGHAVLIWNERQLDTTPFLIEYEQFLLKYATDYTKVRHENVDALRLDEFFRVPFERAVFPNVQVFDFAGLKGRMFSSSYMPNEDDAVAPAMLEDLAAIFAKHSRDGRIEVFYDTRVYHASL
jgi:ubiquinone/menaquinone biosynthesis C-methylase UbiE